MVRNLFIISALSLLFQISNAQHSKNVLYIKSKSEKGNVFLKWAPDNSIFWRFANKYGYELHRYTAGNKDAHKIKVHGSPIKPESLEIWEQYAEEDKYIRIAAQTIYGNEEQEVNSAGRISDLILQGKIGEMKYSLALLAVDQSFKAAQLMGLAFIDSSVSMDEKYIYEIHSLIPDSILKTAKSEVFVDPNKETVLPFVYSISSKTHENKVTLSWEVYILRDYYSSWFIERSDDDGKTWAACNENPYIEVFQGKRQPNYLTWSDTLPEYFHEYLFRVRGKSYFSDFGPWSEPISVEAVMPVNGIPDVIEKNIINNEKVHLKWRFPNNERDYLHGFAIETSNKYEGPFTQVNDSLLSKFDSVYIYTAPSPESYVRITAIDYQDKKHTSYKHFIQLSDTIPPSPPIGLTGHMDTTGTVSISWLPNTEADINSYRVFFANDSLDEFSLLTNQPLFDTTYTCHFNPVSTFNLYFRLVATDIRFNRSRFSKILTVVRPDLIPPAKPTIASYEITDSCTILYWHPSPDEDAIENILYRTFAGSGSWEVLEKYASVTDTMIYFDETCIKDILYDYSLMAIDTAGNASGYSQHISLECRRNPNRNKHIVLNAKADRVNMHIKLNWNNMPLANKYYIYKAKKEQQMRLEKIISPDNPEYIDEDISINTKYTYSVRSTFIDGSSSKMSNPITIKF